MNRVRSIIFSLIFLTICILFPTVPALGSSHLSTVPTATSAPSVEYTLPYPGILPDHPLYFFKELRDQVLILTSQDPAKKIQLYLLLADKQLAAGQLLWEKGNVDLGINTFSKGEKYLLTATLDLIRLKNKTVLPSGLRDKLDLAARKHQETITKLVSIVTEESKRQRLTEILGTVNQTMQQIAAIK